jgi:hypothetical protein
VTFGILLSNSEARCCSARFGPSETSSYFSPFHAKNRPTMEGGDRHSYTNG